MHSHDNPVPAGEKLRATRAIVASSSPGEQEALSRFRS
jgi:hypothetical protein